MDGSWGLLDSNCEELRMQSSFLLISPLLDSLQSRTEGIHKAITRLPVLDLRRCGGRCTTRWEGSYLDHADGLCDWEHSTGVHNRSLSHSCSPFFGNECSCVVLYTQISSMHAALPNAAFNTMSLCLRKAESFLLARHTSRGWFLMRMNSESMRCAEKVRTYMARAER